MAADDRRALILQAAERLLCRHGPKATVAEIAREADVAVGSVYLEFPSKEAIVEALSRKRHGAVLDAMRHAAAQPAPFGERFRLVFAARLHAFRREGAGVHARELVACGSAPVQMAHACFLGEERGFLADLVAAAMAAGELAPRDAHAVADALLAAYAAFAPPLLFQERRADEEVDALLDVVTDLLLAGLLRRP